MGEGRCEVVMKPKQLSWDMWTVVLEVDNLIDATLKECSLHKFYVLPIKRQEVFSIARKKKWER